jgi:hypothetical protein
MNSGKNVGKFCLDCTKATHKERVWLFEEIHQRKKSRISFDEIDAKYYIFDNFQYLNHLRKKKVGYPLITIAELQKMCQEPTIYELW